VLFGDVELQRADDPQRLAQLGLSLQQKGRKLGFPQPCACYDGQFCRAYADRPARCRTFECRVLKRVVRGEITTGAALRLIEKGRQQSQRVREVIQALGGAEKSQALTAAYAEVMAQPIDLGRPGTARRSRAKLASLMDDLMTLLYREFLS
jgi:hypothetical protein